MQIQRAGIDIGTSVFHLAVIDEHGKVVAKKRFSPNQQWHRDRGHQAPHYERMPFPLPDVVKQPPGMMAEMFHLLAAKWQAACVKEVYTQFDEWQKQQRMQRSNGVQTDKLSQ